MTHITIPIGKLILISSYSKNIYFEASYICTIINGYKLEKKNRYSFYQNL